MMFIALLTPFCQFHPINYRKKKKLLIVNFIMIICLQGYVRIVGIADRYKYISLIGSFLILIILLLSLEKDLKLVEWKKSLCYAWFSLCLIMIISDFIISKKYNYLGYIFFTVFLLLFFVWNNAVDQDFLWTCFMDSIRYVFILTAILSFLFRPFNPDFRYSGFTINPNILALFLITVYACYINRFDYFIRTSSDIKHCIKPMIGISLCFFFLYLTKTKTAILAVFFMSLLWLLLLLYTRKKTTYRIPLYRYIASLFCSIFVCFPIFYIGLSTIPSFINHPIVFDKDQNFVYKNSANYIVSKAADSNYSTSTPDSTKDSRDSSYDLLDKLSSGRIRIYKDYIHHLNLWGHIKISRVINGTRYSHAHNNILQFAYTYGIFAMIPYLLINILSLLFSIRYYIRKPIQTRNAAFPPLLTVGFLIASLTECIYLPFQSLLAFSYWIVIGTLLPKEV